MTETIVALDLIPPGTLLAWGTTLEATGLINRAALIVARIVVEADLIWALDNRVSHAAAMDVFVTKPLQAASDLIGVPGLVLTSHVAAETFEPTVLQMFSNIGHVARSKPIPEQDLVH